jgi:hypothetical protein
MEDNEIRWRLNDFKNDFQLTRDEVNLIAKAGMPGFEKRVRRMNIIRREMRKMVKPEAMRAWLFAHNKALGDSYFNIMAAGYFDKVIEDIYALKEGVFV